MEILVVASSPGVWPVYKNELGGRIQIPPSPSWICPVPITDRVNDHGYSGYLERKELMHLSLKMASPR